MATERVLVQAMGIESGCIYHLLVLSRITPSGKSSN